MNRRAALLLIFAAIPPLLVGMSQVADPATRRRVEEVFGKPTPDMPTPTSTTSSVINRVGNDTNKPPSEPLVNGTECMMDDNVTLGMCILHYQCNTKNKSDITGDPTLFDLRQSKCPHYLQVCCKSGDVSTAPRTTPPTVEGAECGWSNSGAHSFRVSTNSTYAEFGEYPWMVAVLRKTDANTAWSSDDYLGGGSIIHRSVVLTVAHKFKNITADKIKCRAGEYDTQTDLEMYPYQEKDVNKIVIHEDFYRPSVLNNVALLFLKSPFELLPHVGVACVGREPPPPGTLCQSMGWGKQNFKGKGKYAVILKKVELPTVGRVPCQQSLRRTRLGSRFVLHSSLTCAGGEPDRDTCTGDGGAPLVCNLPTDDGESGSGRFAVFGLVAWGIGCGEKDIPGVYVNVPEFYDWIGQKITAEGFGTDSYKY